ASGSSAPSGSAVASASPSASPAVVAGNTRLPTEGKLGEVARALQGELGPIAEQSSLTTIGPVVSSDLISQALVLILVGSIGIMLWITLRFRDAKFGVTALIALAHDVIVVIGIFAILGTFFNVKIDALFVTAMLTVIGFSVHDTIVVFDRVRENRARHAGEPFAEIVNHSLLQTFARSITTSFTVFITLLVLLLFGGSAISGFVLALVVGIVSGTYSSIFVASPLLVDWHLWDDRRHGRIASTRTTRVRRAAS
nr:protein translocase subunit SecF [Chloroflexota bacterium]